MRIFDLALKNIGPFNKEYIKLRDENIEGSSVTMITGMNGSGKSVIIDAIRTLFLGLYSNRLERNIIRDENNFYIKANIFDGEKKYLLESDKLSDEGHIYSNDNTIGYYMYAEGATKPNWILDYWSSFINRDTYKTSFIQSIDTKNYLKNSLVGNKPNADIGKLIIFFDYLKSSHEEQEREVGVYMFNKMIDIINSSLSNAQFSHVSRATLEPIVVTQNAEVTLEKLSSGNSYLIQKLLSLLSQAYSIYQLNGGEVKGGEIKNICNVPGLLLMDEAEHHLHPKWQKTFLQTILKFFPNLQIILTTHSPLLISSIENARILVTKSLNDHSIVEDATDYYANKPVEEILRTTLFETDSFNKEISDLLKERKEAIRNDDDEKAEAIEGELIKENPEYFKYLNIDKL